MSGRAKIDRPETCPYCEPVSRWRNVASSPVSCFITPAPSPECHRVITLYGPSRPVYVLRWFVRRPCQEAIELAGCLECGEVACAADVAAVDDDLGEGSRSWTEAGTQPRPTTALLGGHFAERDALLPQDTLRVRAAATETLREDGDIGHPGDDARESVRSTFAVGHAPRWVLARRVQRRQRRFIA